MQGIKARGLVWCHAGPVDRGTPFPPLSEAEARVTHLRAAMARMVRASITTSLDVRSWAELVADLPPEARIMAEAEGELPEWVPIEAITAWIAAFARTHARVPRGVSIADQLLDHAHPWIQRALDPALAMEAMPRIFQHYHRGGALYLLEHGAELARLELWAFVPYPGWHDMLLPAVLHRALERCGAGRVTVRLEGREPGQAPFHHRYEARWERA